MKRIAYILNNFPALSETFIVNEILELKRAGFDIRIYARKKQESTKCGKDVLDLAKEVYYFHENEAPILRKMYLHLYFLFRSPIRYIRATLFVKSLGDKGTLWRFRQSVFLAKKIVDTKSEHIHAHFANLATEYAMWVSKLTGIPYSFTTHAVDIFADPKFIKEKINNAKFVVTISNYNKNYFIENYPGINSEKIKVIHCGVKIPPPENLIKKETDIFTILSVGRLVRKKGFSYLIDACSILRHKEGIDFKCEIIGEGPQRDVIRQCIISNKLDGLVTLRGELAHEEVLRNLKKADLFVLPSITELDNNRDGIPVSLMEAMAAGVPIISTTVSGIPELVKDGAGLLVPEKDVGALSEAIRKIYRLKEDERRKMGEVGRRIVETEFNPKYEIEKLVRLFTDADRIFS